MTSVVAVANSISSSTSSKFRSSAPKKLDVAPNTVAAIRRLAISPPINHFFLDLRGGVVVPTGVFVSSIFLFGLKNYYM